MQVIFRQTFPLGRFHANPWRMFPFEDPYGEWPPSPWRMLRAILARSYQYERESTLSFQPHRASFVRAFSTSVFRWWLPPFSWRGTGLRHYQPAVFEFDPRQATKKVDGQTRKIPGKKKYAPTLVYDNFWVVDHCGDQSSSGIVWWILEGERWSEDEFYLLDASLERMTYFGRAEAITEIRRVEKLPNNIDANCVLEQSPSLGTVPVLVPITSATLEQAQARTDDPSVRKSSVPPGAHWLYATRPSKPPVKLRRNKPIRKPPVDLVQFAIGTKINPKVKSTVVLTQRFRGRVIRRFLGCNWQRANFAMREAARLLAGKESDGSPLRDQRHSHARFGILFDDQTGKATRLLVWRDLPFTNEEQCAILDAAEQELPFSFAKFGKNDSWTVRLVPLDSQVPPPAGFEKETYRFWDTVTPYVPPRYAYDRKGKVKAGESPEAQLRLELDRQGYDTSGLSIEVKEEATEWVRVHRPRRNRDEPSNADRIGHQVTLEFNNPVRGPISLGHSSHFGLGLFRGWKD